MSEELVAPGRKARTGRRGTIASLAAMRAIYAINWLNIGSIFPFMALDLGSGVTGLGVATSSFYVGVGLLQVPGGLLAAKWGAKRVVLVGITTYSLCAMASSLSPNLPTLALLRFGVGAGMAFVFAPAVVIVAETFGSRDSGLGVGMLNSAFDVGGVFGLFVWGNLAAELGWRPSLLASGGIGLATAFLVAFAVPGRSPGDFKLELKGLSKILLDKRLVLIGIGLLSLDFGNTLLSGFMVYYLRQTFALGEASAATIASLVVVIPIFFALAGGRIYDRLKRPRLLMLVSGVAMGASLIVCVAGSVAAAVLGCALGGVMSGIGFTVGFATAREFNAAEREYETLAVSWVNGISLFGTFVPPLLFSYIAAGWGYSLAWFVGGAVTVLLALCLVFLKESPAARAA